MILFLLGLLVGVTVTFLIGGHLAHNLLVREQQREDQLLKTLSSINVAYLNLSAILMTFTPKLRAAIDHMRELLDRRIVAGTPDEQSVEIESIANELSLASELQRIADLLDRTVSEKQQ